MSAIEPEFQKIYDVVRAIPRGSVLAYGEVAKIAGSTARTVGWAMGNVTDPDIPWQRVVGADGYLRIGARSPELKAKQHRLLLEEGVAFLENGSVDMAKQRDSAAPPPAPQTLSLDLDE